MKQQTTDIVIGILIGACILAGVVLVVLSSVAGKRWAADFIWNWF